MANEWVVRVTADVKGVLDASRQIGQAGKQAGQQFKEGFSSGDQTITGLRGRLNELNQTLEKSVIGSKEFVAAQKEIAATQQKINDALKGFAAGEGTINGLRNKMAALNETLGQSVIGSKEFVAAQKEIAQTQDRLNAALKGFRGNENSIEGLNNKLASYNATLQKAEIGSREFIAAQRGIARTQQEINTALNGFSGKEQTVSGLRARLAELNQTLEKTAIGSRNFNNTQREIAATQREVDRALGQTNAAAKALGGVFSGLAALGAGFAVFGFFKNSIKEAADLETISRKLSVTLGSQGAAGSLGFVRETADKLGLSYKDLANNFGSFTAAATASGVPLKQQKDLFAAVAKAGQALGLTNEGINGTFVALQQIASKGVVSMEELRQQLGERLPIALSATANGLGISEQALIKLVETGKLTSSQFFPAFTKGLEELTEDAGGVLTAAQNFNKLQNAWIDLQASFGTSLLPDVIAGVKTLAAVLDGIQVDRAGFDLTGLGFAGTEAIQTAAQLKQVQKTYNLTNTEAKNLLSNVVATSRATRNWFGQLNTDGGVYSKIQLGIIDAAEKWRAKNKDIKGEQNEIKAIETKRLEDARLLNIEKAKELVRQGQIAEAVGRTLQAEASGRVEAQQAGINLGQALIGLDESRFSILRNTNAAELSQFEKRRAQLVYELEFPDKLEAARAKVEDAEATFEQAKASRSDEAIRRARLGLQIANLDLEALKQSNALKKQGEEIDRAALTFKYQALLQQQELERVLLSLKQEQARQDATQTADAARIEIKKAEIALTQAIASGNKDAIADANLELQKAQLNLQAANSKLQILSKTQAIEALIAGVTGQTAQNNIRAEAAAKSLALAADSTFKAAKGTNEQFNSFQDKLSSPLGQQKTFQALIRDTGLQVKNTGQGYYEITGYIGDAAKATGVARRQTAGLASNMSNAADAARSFYNSLNAAAGLPPARFTGGPVDAGGTYRINDGPSGMTLGQESFLSASGALSLINRPMNSLWTAPSKGTVIPAHMTSRLKEAGALGGAGVLRAGPDPAIAHLAAAVGNLSQEVAELRRKAWNVTVPVHSDGSSLRLQKTVQRIR